MAWHFTTQSGGVWKLQKKDASMRTKVAMFFLAVTLTVAAAVPAFAACHYEYVYVCNAYGYCQYFYQWVCW